MGEEPNFRLYKSSNPHCVIFQDKGSTINFLKTGKDLQDNSYFPDGVNFGLANILSDSEMDLEYMKEVQERPQHVEAGHVQLR